MKKTLVVGNWKMHLNVSQASTLVHRLQQHVPLYRDVEVVLGPSLLTLQPVSLEVDRRKFRLAAQNANATDEGAMTGEVSFTMLHGLVHYGIIGHSERRTHFHDTLETVRDKTQAAVRNKIVPIVCVGETSLERHAGETKRVVHDQVTTAFANLTAEEVAESVIAYEPVWAIGSGQAATPADAEKVIMYIRHVIEGLYGEHVAEDIRILYGGSVVPEFVKGLLGAKGVDGFLVGGASLNYKQFAGIVTESHAYNAGKKHDESKERHQK